MKCDIVLVNEAVTPPICKAYNYKEHLYKQFIKEIGHMSSQRKCLIKYSYKKLHCLYSKGSQFQQNHNRGDPNH